MRSTAIVLGLAASMVSAAALPPSDTCPLPVGEIGWQGVATPGGPEVEVWGETFEVIEAKIKKQYNPDFSIYSVEEQEEEEPGTSEDPAIAARGQLERRWRNRNCDTRYGEVVSFYAERAFNALRHINGNSCKARARTCIRTQCIDDAAVGLCNDNHHDINIACTEVANMAQEIVKRCYWAETTCDRTQNCWISPYDKLTAGQLFADNLSWNVIVGSCSFFGGGERPVKA